jgi:hypothetical protein
MSQEKFGQSGDEDPLSNRESTRKLVKDIRSGEAWIIGIGVVTLVVNVAIALIYYGQLVEMRKSTDAATEASLISNSTLTELKSGSGAKDTHTLAQQAVTQATQTKTLLSTVDAQAQATKLLADRAADQAATAAQQAATAEALAAQSNRLADAAEKANANAVGSDRPWIAVHSFVDLVAGKPAMVTVSALNSGHRPAKLTAFAANGSMYEVFPDMPTYMDDAVPSAGILVPGDSSAIQFTIPVDVVNALLASSTAPAVTSSTPAVAGGVAAPQAQYYIYADVEYTDVASGGQHSSHACWVYMPKTETAPAEFVLAHVYNEAK